MTQLSDPNPWPYVVAFAVVLGFAFLITLVASKPGGKFRVRIFGRFFEIEHDGKRDKSEDNSKDNEH